MWSKKAEEINTKPFHQCDSCGDLTNRIVVSVVMGTMGAYCRDCMEDFRKADTLSEWDSENDPTLVG